MTIIVWDGKILAADRQATSNGIKREVTKIRKIGDSLYGISGSFDRCMALFHWVENGKDPEKWPAFQRDSEDWVYMCEIAPGGIVKKYEREPYPMYIEETQYAQGCGRDYAMGAMWMGAGAVDAVKAACQYDSNCGMGIDILALDDSDYVFTIRPSTPSGGKSDIRPFTRT